MALQTLVDDDGLDRALGAPGRMWIFKHSNACPVSLAALEQVERHLAAHDEPAAMVVVQTHRPLSNRIASRLGVFGATFITFFLAEMGDKTQVATIAMAAHYAQPLLVVAGTTLGMLIADVPAVFVGDRLAGRIPMKLVHGIAAAVFAALGVATLLGAGATLGF